MLRFILTGLCLLQLQVTYSSCACRGSKPVCFPFYDPISTNEIRDEPFCNKQPKESFFLFPPKPLHRFQPFFLNGPKLFGNLQNPLAGRGQEKRIAGAFCGMNTKEASNINNVPEVIMEVGTPPSCSEETGYDEEASKQCTSSGDAPDKESNMSFENFPENEIISSSGPTSVDTEEKSPFNTYDNNPFSQCGPEMDRGMSTDSIQSECGGQASKPEEDSESPEGSSCTTQITPMTMVCETPQMFAFPIKPEIPQPFPNPSISLDAACGNVSIPNTVDAGESSPHILNTECVSPTSAPIVKETFSGIAQPTRTEMSHIYSTRENTGITNQVIAENPVSIHVLSNMITGLSSINTKASPSFVKPIYEEIVHHVPTVRNVVRHHLVETTHHVPIIEKIVQHERQDIIRHIPIVQKFTRNVVECRKKHIPIVGHRTRTVEEHYVEHVPRTEKITRPVIETLVRHVPVVFSRYRPVVHQRIRHVPTVETRCVPVVEETITTVPVRQKVIKHVVEDRIRPIDGLWSGSTPDKALAPPSSIPLGVDSLCKF